LGQPDAVAVTVTVEPALAGEAGATITASAEHEVRLYVAVLLYVSQVPELLPVAPALLASFAQTEKR
jgi:hypothetical protein